MTLEAGTHIGKYVVRRKLAEGGMAEIYLCTARGPEGFEKEVVIKRVRPFLATDSEFVQMFIAEARLASRLNHANVVQIFDFDKHEDTYYLAMEYVRGCSLWELRRRCKELVEPVPPTLVAHIGAEVARGLHYAHRLKVDGAPLHLVHRDVTPHNVLLSFDGSVKLTDFGIAKAGNKLTQPGVLKGKFAYMSPEQARGEPVDARTDVFALGVVLWEMLTGGRLFEGDSEVAVLRAVQQSAIAPPARLNPDVPADLDAAVTRALARDASARFQTAGELERALAQCVLKHATSVDDADVSLFLRRLFPAAATQMALPAVHAQERTHVGEGGPPGEDMAPAPVPREPTAVLPGGARGRGSAAVASPDEDVNASTFVLPRREEPGPSVPPPPSATPMMPLPAVGFTVRPASREQPAQSAAPTPVGATVQPASREQPAQPAALPPLAAPIASVRPSRPEGVSSVASPEAGEGSSGGASSARTPSRSEGVSSVASPGLAESPSRGEDSVVARRPSHPEVAVAGVSATPEGEGHSAGARPTGWRGPLAAGASATPEGEGRSAGARPAGRRGPLWAGAAVLGLAGVVGVVAVVRSRTDTPPAVASAPVGAPAPLGATGSPRDVKVASPASAPVTEPRGSPSEGAVAAAPGGAGAARDIPGADPEVEGQEREAALAPGPTSASGDARPSSPEASPSAGESTGTLKVRATPYATVFLDGKRLGEVQGQASYRLAAGTYKLTFQHPTGAKSFTVTVPASGTVSQDFRASTGR